MQALCFSRKEQTMSRWIDADALIAQYKGDVLTAQVDYAEGVRDVIEDIKTAPSIDIVRCQDCKHWVYNFKGCKRNPFTEPWYATDFCNYGEREGE